MKITEVIQNTARKPRLRWIVYPGTWLEFDGVQFWYGSGTLFNPLSCFTPEFQVKICRTAFHRRIAMKSAAMEAAQNA